jgi:hypothetical protein
MDVRVCVFLSSALDGVEWSASRHIPGERDPCSFIFVGCILLRYLHILYKHTTQNYTYVIRKTQLITSLLFQNLTTCFGPYGPSSGNIFEDSHSTAIHPPSLQV